MMRRAVHLQDLKYVHLYCFFITLLCKQILVSNITLTSYLIARGSTIELSLSGKRATEFDGETILQVGQEHHVIAIFVGTLMKTYKNDYKFLSGTSACRWYINQNDIPEIEAFQTWYNTHTGSSNHSLKKYIYVAFSKILIYDMINSYRQKQFLFKSCIYEAEIMHNRILRKELCSNSKMSILLLKG